MARNWKTLPGVRHMKSLNGGAPLNMSGRHPIEAICTSDQIQDSEKDIKVFAVISTWNDADIIGASCIHHKKQGVDKIVILDNDSSDDSVEEAMKYGASEAQIYTTEFYDDDLRVKLQNDIARSFVEEKTDECWVLSLDADEFLHGTNGRTVKQMLASLPCAFRTVGSYSLDLFPDSEDSYERLHHPLLSMRNGVLRRSDFCSRWHWKHVALRYTNGVFDIAQTRGNHIPALSPEVQSILEPKGIELPLIHAPWRNRKEAEWRLNLLCDGGKSRRSKMDDDVTGSGGAIRRWKNLRNVYAGYWDRVELPHCEMMYGRTIKGIVPYPFEKYFPDISL